MWGRSHGMHAEPITLGLKLANWYSELERHKNRLIVAMESMNYGKISGAVGTYSHIIPKLESLVCENLGLYQVDISNQILQRDRHANYISTLAMIGSSLEKFATEIRHLARTEVHEIEEPFTVNQKGSSAMPHKRNPIRSENICGCARVLRGYALTAMENITLWHERDISHSSSERIIFPDSTILLYHMFTKMINIVDNMVVYEENMKKNMDLTKRTYLSQRVLLQLIDQGISREEAYRVVQKCAMDVLNNGGDFLDKILDMGYSLINIDNSLKFIDYTFDKVFSN
jgi:adenylosuccinate lyase